MVCIPATLIGVIVGIAVRITKEERNWMRILNSWKG